MDQDEAIRRARAAFLDDAHELGCAETTFTVLHEGFGLPGAADPSAAMALNGGVAYSGGTCGAITGAALAVGLLAGVRIEDHGSAKRVARALTARLIDEFEAEHGSAVCRELIGRDIRTAEQHEAFIADGGWRETCMRQIEHAIRSMAPLADAGAWALAARQIDESDEKGRTWRRDG